MSITVNVRTADGIVTLSVKPMTEAQAIAYSDKRAASRSARERLADYTDNGDNEVLDCITTPDRAAVLELLEDYPALTQQFGARLEALGGDDLELRETPFVPLPDVIAAHGKRTICVKADGMGEVVLKKFSRAESLFILQEPHTKRTGRVSFATLAREAKAHAIGADAALWERWPFLSMSLGLLLWSKANAQLEVSEGK